MLLENLTFPSTLIASLVLILSASTRFTHVEPTTLKRITALMLIGLGVILLWILIQGQQTALVEMAGLLPGLLIFGVTVWYCLKQVQIRIL